MKRLLIIILITHQAGFFAPGFATPTGFTVPGFSAIPAGDDLHSLCSGRHINLVMYTQLKALVDKLSSKPQCPEHVTRPLEDLLKLYESHEAHVCSKEKVKEILRYYNDYLDTSNREKARRNKLPESLKGFFLAYATKINQQCKIHMMFNLLEWGTVLNRSKESSNPQDGPVESDFALLKQWTHDEGAAGIGSLMNEIVKPSKKVLPSDLVAVMPDKELVEKKKVTVTNVGSINRAQEICRKRFKPIYEPLVWPVAALTRAGFDIPDILMELHSTEDVYEGMAEWTRAVFLCETLDFLDINVDDSGRASFESDIEPLESPKFKPSESSPNFVIHSYEKKILQKFLRSFDSSKTDEQRRKDILIRKGLGRSEARLKQDGCFTAFKLLLNKLARGMGSSQKGDREGLIDLVLKKHPEISRVELQSYINDP
jgi:hypothetical protein